MLEKGIDRYFVSISSKFTVNISTDKYFCTVHRYKDTLISLQGNLHDHLALKIFTKYLYFIVLGQSNDTNGQKRFSEEEQWKAT